MDGFSTIPIIEGCVFVYVREHASDDVTGEKDSATGNFSFVTIPDSMENALLYSLSTPISPIHSPNLMLRHWDEVAIDQRNHHLTVENSDFKTTTPAILSVETRGTELTDVEFAGDDIRREHEPLPPQPGRLSLRSASVSNQRQSSNP